MYASFIFWDVFWKERGSLPSILLFYNKFSYNTQDIKGNVLPLMLLDVYIERQNIFKHFIHNLIDFIMQYEISHLNSYHCEKEI